MKTDKDILIAGGSGLIGQEIADQLANDYPDRVIIAGRDLEKASRLAAHLGRGIRARAIDVNNRSSIDRALKGVGTIMNCVAPRETPLLLLAAISQGCGYTDIAPMWLHQYPLTEALEAEAVKTGARIIFGAGMVPGISSMLARIGADWVGPMDSVASTCLLSAGDEYGPNSREYLQQEFMTPFQTMINGKKVQVWPFTRPRRVRFAPPVGQVTAYLIPFSDQLYYPKTLDARTAVAQLAFLPQWPIWLLSALLPLIRGSLAQRGPGTRGELSNLLGWLKRKYKNLDWWGVHVEVRGAGGIYQASVQGHQQAQAVALCAAAFLQALLAGEVEPAGIWGAEQVVPVDPFLKRLAAHGLIPTVTTTGSAPVDDYSNATNKEAGIL